jgi:hypothetical protein
MIRSIEIGDRAGIVAAVACAVHCSVLPIAATSIQLGNVLLSEQTELVVLAASLLISGTAIVASCVRRGLCVVVGGTFSIAVGLFLAARLELAAPFEQPLVMAAAGLIVATHVINLARCPCRKDRPSCVTAE